MESSNRLSTAAPSATAPAGCRLAFFTWKRPTCLDVSCFYTKWCTTLGSSSVSWLLLRASTNQGRDANGFEEGTVRQSENWSNNSGRPLLFPCCYIWLFRPLALVGPSEQSLHQGRSCFLRLHCPATVSCSNPTDKWWQDHLSFLVGQFHQHRESTFTFDGERCVLSRGIVHSKNPRTLLKKIRKKSKKSETIRKILNKSKNSKDFFEDSKSVHPFW